MVRLSVHPSHRSGVSGSEDLALGVAVVALALFFPEGFLDLGGYLVLPVTKFHISLLFPSYMVKVSIKLTKTLILTEKMTVAKLLIGITVAKLLIGIQHLRLVFLRCTAHMVSTMSLK